MNVQTSLIGGRNCPLFLSDEKANRGTGKTIGLTQLVFQEAKIGGCNVVRMANKECEDRGLHRHLGYKGRFGDLGRFAYQNGQRMRRQNVL